MDQQLYELPDGWEWKNIEDVSYIGSKKGFVPQPDLKGMVPFVGMTHIDQETGLGSTYELRPLDEVKKGYTKFENNAVLIAKITPCTENNKTALLKFKNGGYATTEVYPVHPLESLSPLYFLYYCRSHHVRNILISKMEGATGRQRVPLKALKEISIPLPSLSEQKRIVEKLDALLSRIDQAVNHLQESLRLSEALFESSLAGLFEKFKNEYGVVGLNEVVHINSGIALPSIFKTDNVSGTIPFYKVAQMNNDEKIMKNADLFFTSEQANEEKIKIFPKGSILIPKRGGAILTNKKRYLIEDASYDSNIMGLKADENIITNEYLYTFLMSINLADYVDASTIPQINNKHIAMMSIPLPPLSKQKKMVENIERLSAKNKDLKEKLQGQIDDLNALKASLLDAAFRGEL